MDLGLAGRTAIVTGGASGIGRAACDLLEREGVRVALWDLAPADGATTSFSVDVANMDSVREAVDRTRSALGQIDVLVHAAAIGSGKFGFPFTNLSPDDWPRVLEVNVLGMVNMAHALAPGMIERGRGAMVFLASVAGQIGSPTDPPYSASKAANINFAQCLARDLAAHGIRVNTVCPGMVRTPLNRSVWQAWHDRQPPELRLSYEEWADQKVRSLVPLGRWQKPEDVANLIVFLASDRASEITGQTINVDGGYVMHW